MSGIERILVRGRELAIIVRAEYVADGIEFFTDDAAPQQLGYMNRPAGYVIDPHLHLTAVREVSVTQEVLFVRKGKIRIDFFDDDQSYLESRELVSGDAVLLAHGGHGISIIEPTEMLEVKQGPYMNLGDKARFKSDPSIEITVRNQ